MQQYKVDPLQVTIAAPCQRVCDAIDYIFSDPSVKPTWFELGATKWANVAKVPLSFQVKLVETGKIATVEGIGDFSFELTDKGASTDLVVRLAAECEKPDWANDGLMLELLDLMNELVVENIEDDAIGMNEADGPEAA